MKYYNENNESKSKDPIGLILTLCFIAFVGIAILIFLVL